MYNITRTIVERNSTFLWVRAPGMHMLCPRKHVSWATCTKHKAYIEQRTYRKMLEHMLFFNSLWLSDAYKHRPVALHCG